MAEFADNQLIEINDVDINDAKYFSNSFDDESVRKKAFLNSLGANVGFKFLASLGINAVNEKSLYTCKSILKNIEISDLNVGDIRIDTRLIFNDEEIFIPKSQFKYGITPELYLIFKVPADLFDAAFLGFILPQEMNIENENENYYFIEKSQLHSSSELITLMDEGLLKPPLELNNEDLLLAQTLLLELIDDTINDEAKRFLFKVLLNSPQTYQQLIELENFEVLSTQLVNDEELIKGTVLDNGINLDKIAEATNEDFVEEYKNDIVEEVSEEKDELPVPSLFEEEEEEEPVLAQPKEVSSTQNDDDEIVLTPQIKEAPPENVKLDDLSGLNEENTFDLIDEAANEEKIDDSEFEIPNIELENIEFEEEPIIKAPPETSVESNSNEINEIYNQVKPNDRPSEKIQEELNENVYEQEFPTKTSKKNKNPLLMILVLLIFGTVLSCGYLIYKKGNLLITKVPKLNSIKTQVDEYGKKIKDIELFKKEPESVDEILTPIEEKEVKTQQPSVIPQYKNPNQRIQKIEWEIPQDISTNEEVVKYLQTVGKTLKISLQNDLLAIPPKTVLEDMVLNIRLTESGNIKGIKIAVSSGQPNADKIVLQSVKASIQYVKPLSKELKTDYSDLTLIINF